MIGGEDLTGQTDYPDHDRKGMPRTGNSGVGWSMGPYEYDNEPLPHIIYVSEPAFNGTTYVNGNHGDDGHPLGTRQAPFASLAHAYDIARTNSVNAPRTEVTEIHIAEGSYNVGNGTTFSSGPDICILGGYDKNTWARDLANNHTELEGTGNAVLTLNASFTRDFLLEGIALRNTGTASTTDALSILNGSPLIRDNILTGGNGSSGRGVNIENSAPEIIGNTIYGGNATSSCGIRLFSADNTRIINNVIHGGNANQSTRGVDIDDGSNKTFLFSNTIFGGRSTNSDSAGIHTSNSARPHLVNNIIIAGTAGPPNSARGIYEGSSSTPFRFFNNLLLSINQGGGVPYRTGSGQNISDPNTLESYLTSSGSAADNTLLNFSENPSVYFHNFIPGHNYGEFSGENWRLTGAGTQNAAGGGINQKNDQDYSFNTDRDGKTRTDPWSIGAYEY
jgi:hypothetical protein